MPVDKFKPALLSFAPTEAGTEEKEQMKSQGPAEPRPGPLIFFLSHSQDFFDLVIGQDGGCDFFFRWCPTSRKGGKRIIFKISERDLVVEGALEILDIFPYGDVFVAGVSKICDKLVAMFKRDAFDGGVIHES